MKQSTFVRGPRCLGACWLAMALAVCAWPVRADGLKVVVVSAQDRAAADKLSELIREPFVRELGAGSVASDDPASYCTTGENVVLVLDSARDAVRLVRCRDGAVLSRAIDPAVARATPYLTAFVGAELIQLNAELKDTRVESAAASRAAGVSDSVSDLARSAWRLQIRAGAETFALAAPFSALPRPTLGVGLLFARAPGSLVWLVELQLSTLAQATRQRGSESLTLRRNDGRLRAGLQWPLGALSVGGVAHLRASLTQARYGSAADAQALVRLGIGAGLEANWELARWLALYADALADVATSRSKYQVYGDPWASDPWLVVSCSLGLIVRAQL